VVPRCYVSRVTRGIDATPAAAVPVSSCVSAAAGLRVTRHRATRAPRAMHAPTAPSWRRHPAQHALQERTAALATQRARRVPLAGTPTPWRWEWCVQPCVPTAASVSQEPRSRRCAAQVCNHLLATVRCIAASRITAVLYASDAGRYGATLGLTTANCTAACPNGHYSEMNAIRCTQCPPGLFHLYSCCLCCVTRKKCSPA
jgi:hypothetical protein